MSIAALTNPELSADQLKPVQVTSPSVFVLIVLTADGELKNATVRISKDVASAHAFAQAFMLNKFMYLYTELKINGVAQPPIPEVVYLAMAQKEAWDLRSMGMGVFRDLDEAKHACSVMSAKDAEFNNFQVTTCPVQLGLTEADDDYLGELNQCAVDTEMKSLQELLEDVEEESDGDVGEDVEEEGSEDVED
jgi:hypothetical protein